MSEDTCCDIDKHACCDMSEDTYYDIGKHTYHNMGGEKYPVRRTQITEASQNLPYLIIIPRPLYIVNARMVLYLLCILRLAT